jgi:hypothetical protein
LGGDGSERAPRISGQAAQQADADDDDKAGGGLHLGMEEFAATRQQAARRLKKARIVIALRSKGRSPSVGTSATNISAAKEPNQFLCGNRPLRSPASDPLI